MSSLMDFRCRMCRKVTPEIAVTPCCGELVCWDNCLSDETEQCPVCRTPIEVERNPDKSFYLKVKEVTK